MKTIIYSLWNCQGRERVIYIYVYADAESINIHRLNIVTRPRSWTRQESWFCELQEVTECHNLSDVRMKLIYYYNIVIFDIVQVEGVGDERNCIQQKMLLLGSIVCVEYHNAIQVTQLHNLYDASGTIRTLARTSSRREY